MNNSPLNIRSLPSLRYSPRPRATYTRTQNGHAHGPAASALLDTTETWNLAYLSHDFETRLDHPDPQFTTNVRRTCQTLLDGTGVDLTGFKIGQRLGSLLQLPAPRFVYLVLRHPILQKLPMYAAYGPSWLHQIDQRSRLCSFEPGVEGKVVGDEVGDMSQAALVLNRIRSNL